MFFRLVLSLVFVTSVCVSGGIKALVRESWPFWSWLFGKYIGGFSYSVD